jgi:hypothetical protein
LKYWESLLLGPTHYNNTGRPPSWPGPPAFSLQRPCTCLALFMISPPQPHCRRWTTAHRYARPWLTAHFFVTALILYESTMRRPSSISCLYFPHHHRISHLTSAPCSLRSLPHLLCVPATTTPRHCWLLPHVPRSLTERVATHRPEPSSSHCVESSKASTTRHFLGLTSTCLLTARHWPPPTLPPPPRPPPGCRAPL